MDRVVEQTQRLMKSLVKMLLTKGIRHNTYQHKLGLYKIVYYEER